MPRMHDLGYEFFYGQGVTVVEWPERMEYLRPHEYLGISIEKVLTIAWTSVILGWSYWVGYEKFAKEWII